MKKLSERVLYCHCTYAKVIAPEVKREVLKRLCDAGVAFDAVPDLCEMSARNDPSLKALADSGPIKIVACYPRAVKWLFHAAEAPLDDATAKIFNMRTQDAGEIVDALLDESCPTEEALS